MENNKFNILLIEDNPRDIRIIEEMINELDNGNFELMCAENLSSGIEASEKSQFHIILLDLFLPDSLGLDSLNSMLKKAPDIPIVVLSGLDDKSIAIKAVNSGAQDYLIKGSFDSKLIERVIYYAVERQKNKNEILNLSKELKNSEIRLNSLFENAPYAIILHDIKGKIFNVNKEAETLFLYQKEVFLQQNVFSLLDSRSKENFKKLIKKQINENLSINKFQAIVKNRLNTFINVELSSVLLNISDQIIIETYFLDISEKVNHEKNRKFLIDQLLNSLEAKTTFFSAMSHDLRTPLNAIIGFADLLLEGAYGPLSKDQIDFLIDIKGSAIDLLNLIISVLDFTEVESGLFKLNISTFKLMPLVNDINTILKPNYLKKGLRFFLSGIDRNTSINADLLKFKQILYNLFENAIKYTDYGSFSFEGAEKKDYWEFQVNDTGIGIDKKDYEVVFREYERVEKDVRKSVPGSGIGLALTKRLIQLHNGEIWFKSELGKGTTFFFTIPKIL